jgi:PKHD-type hydroxylase
MTRVERNHINREPVVVYRDVFSKEECEALIEIFKGDEVVADFMDEKEGKYLSFIELHKTSCVQHYYDRMFACVTRANKENFKFDPSLYLAENMYINKYSAEDKNYRGWHVDGVFSDNPYYSSRKLSAVVQLSDPLSYTGGELEFMEYHDPKEIISHQGTVVIFPAFEWHKVTPVLSGDRYSMVMFVNGKPFK